MKYFFLLFVAFVLVFISCKEEKPTPKVIYDKQSNSEKTVTKDSSSIKISDLPVQISGTNYLIHPIGDVRLYDDYRKVYGSSKTNNISYAISNYNENELTGYFSNLIFQHKDSLTYKSLTNNNIQIQTVTYLPQIAQKTKRQMLVYQLVDADTNKDGKLDQNDIKSLYISQIDGGNFIKLTQELFELIDWNIIESQNRLYFRSLEDTNKNGAFDKEDKVHYQYINLESKDLKTETYLPY